MCDNLFHYSSLFLYKQKIMKQSTKNMLMFIGGFIWAMKTTTKAYAPTIIHTSPKKPKSQGDCEQDELYREGEWIGETLTDNRCVSSCDIGETRIDTSTTNTMGIYGPEAYFNCVPNSTIYSFEADKVLRQNAPLPA